MQHFQFSVNKLNSLFILFVYFSAGASKKIQSMTFSTEHRADLLTEALVSSFEFSVNKFISHTENCYILLSTLLSNFSCSDFVKNFQTSKQEVKW